MPLIQYGLPWAEQPQTARTIDGGNPLARGLRRLLLPSVSPGYEAARGALESLTGSVSSVLTERGAAIAFDDDSKYLIVNDWAGDVSAGGCMMIGAIPLISNVDGTYVMSARVGSGARLYIRRVGGNNWAYGFNADAQTLMGTGNEWGQGVYGLAALQWDSTAHEFFFNGTQRNSGAGATLAPTTMMLNGLSSGPTVVGNRELNHTLFAAVWDRRLSADEHAAMWENPWQLFEPRRIWVPVAAGAPALPTLSLSTYKPGTLTSSGWTPRVTAT